MADINIPVCPDHNKPYEFTNEVDSWVFTCGCVRLPWTVNSDLVEHDENNKLEYDRISAEERERIASFIEDSEVGIDWSIAKDVPFSKFNAIIIATSNDLARQIRENKF